MSKGLGFLFLGLGLLLGVLASPAAAQSRREMQMMADIRMLQEQTQQLQQQLLAAVDQLSTTLKAINARVDEQAVATRKSFADQKLAVDQFGTDLRIVRERIDENTVRITSLSQEIEALRLAIPQFSVTSPSAPVDPNAPPGTTPPPGSGAAQPPTSPPVTLAPGMSPQRLFDTAMSDYSVGQWALCIEAATDRSEDRSASISWLSVLMRTLVSPVRSRITRRSAPMFSTTRR